jgi:hypothetical protein
MESTHTHLSYLAMISGNFAPQNQEEAFLQKLYQNVSSTDYTKDRAIEICKIAQLFKNAVDYAIKEKKTSMTVFSCRPDIGLEFKFHWKNISLSLPAYTHRAYLPYPRDLLLYANAMKYDLQSVDTEKLEYHTQKTNFRKIPLTLNPNHTFKIEVDILDCSRTVITIPKVWDEKRAAKELCTAPI